MLLIILTLKWCWQCLDLNIDLENEKFKELKSAVQNLIQNSFDDLFKEKSFINFGIDKWMYTLNLIVNVNNVVNAYNAVHDWITHDRENREKYSYDLMSIVKENSEATHKNIIWKKRIEIQFNEK